MGPATSARWFERHAEARQGRSVRRQPRPPTVRCRHCGRHGLVGGPAGPGSTGPSPCGCGDGVAPAPRLPAATPASRQRHRPSLSHGATLGCPTDPPQPVQLCRQWPGAVLQILQVAAAVERPAIEVTGPAPPIAGLRRARRGVVGLGPASAAAAFVEPGSRREGAQRCRALGLPTETPTSWARWVSRCCVRPVCCSGERWPGNGVRRSLATACWPASHRQPAPGRSLRCSTPIRGDPAARRRLARRGSGTRG
jgi:hypothetical protein